MKNQKNQNGLTVKKLCEEIAIDQDQLIPLLEKMGAKDLKEDSIIPLPIAANIRAVIAQRAQLVGSESPRELQKAEVKAIAAETKLTHKLIRELTQALYNRELQVLFMEGLAEAERDRYRLEAYESGKLTAQLQAIQEKNQELKDREISILEFFPSPVEELARSNGINLEELIGEVAEWEKKEALGALTRDQILEKIEQGKELTDQEQSNPVTDWILTNYQKQRRSQVSSRNQENSRN